MVDSVKENLAAAGNTVSRTLNPVFRKGILVATNNGATQRFVYRYGMRLGASRFVAGESLEEAVPVLKELNRKGLRINTTILGEGVKDAAMADGVTEQYAIVLQRLVDEGINGNVALKLTHLGLTIDAELAYANIERLVKQAAAANAFIRIDMEESARVDDTLAIYKRLREAGHDNVGTVLQSYLYRTEQDLRDLLPYKPNLRLVKGAYLEPESIAWPQKADVDANYVKLADMMLENNSFTAIATHDEKIIGHVQRRAKEGGIGPYEFQMLYGIRPQYQLDLVKAGHQVLVATPFGPDWYFFLMRRLAERPANVLFFAKNVIKR
ncbi:MAG: proline dehydrogenase family protein [Thermomicrobiales bacterium]|nr:proline dehydrogenase family protein [Thermomicrobiales bacterium]